MRRLLAAVAFGLLLSATPAHAEITPRAQVPVGGMDGAGSAWLIYGYRGWGSGPGIGARYQKTLLPQGLLNNPSIREDIGIEGGVDFVHYSWDNGYLGSNYSWSYNEFSFVVGPVWNFWVTPQFAVYPKLDIGFGFGSVSTPAGFGGTAASTGGFIFQGAVGVVYKLEKLMLRAEAGSSYVRAGVAMNF